LDGFTFPFYVALYAGYFSVIKYNSMNQPINFWAVVPAAGVGKRMNADRPKQYLELADLTVIEQTLARLLQAEVFAKIAVAISVEDPYWPELAIGKHERIITAPGGKERADSVLSGLKSIRSKAKDDDWVLVHDAARPCLALEDIRKLINTLKDDDVGGILALLSHDTLKNVDGNQILGTLDRQHIWRALTPQMFRYGMLKSALEETAGDPRITDEASALEIQGFTPKIVEGRPDNIKITRPEDLALAQFYLDQQKAQQ
jgi:2-C-methyl-D-erythritol 4-phosphate cytidylyltransferase